MPKDERATIADQERPFGIPALQSVNVDKMDEPPNVGRGCWCLLILAPVHDKAKAPLVSAIRQNRLHRLRPFLKLRLFEVDNANLAATVVDFVRKLSNP